MGACRDGSLRLTPLLRWAERALNGGWIDVPVLSGLLLPCLILPAAGFCSGLSLGKRQGLCPLYPLALALCYLPMVFALYNASALFLCHVYKKEIAPMKQNS